VIETEYLFPRYPRLALLSSLIVKTTHPGHSFTRPRPKPMGRAKPKKNPAPGFPDAGRFSGFVYMIRAPTPRLGLSCGSCEGYHWVFPCKHGRAKPITSEDFARVELVPVWACMIIEVSYLLA
jgi:hypothetical protein